MNPQQLQAFFTKHKGAILGAAAAGVAGLALLQKKNTAAAAGGGGSQPAGTIPAAAVVSQPTGSTYDSSAYDVYSALQPQIAKILEQQNAQTSAGGSGITDAPAPIASTLFAPTGSGNYVRYGSSIAEVESDGSLLGLNIGQWSKLADSGAKYTQLSSRDADLPAFYTVGGNLAKANKAR